MREEDKTRGENKKQPLSFHKFGGLTAISGKLVSIELLGQDHGGPANIRAICVDCLTKSKLFCNASD